MGIGGATARKLASEGTKVFIADIDDTAAATNVDRITQTGGTPYRRFAEADIARMVNETVDQWARLGILVQNTFGVIDGVSII
ncbi:MAG: hypothetical protein CL726_08575 [Chloroflexi bacterium]|nr:hypothetical protein [Chloroflexota bacterium]